MNGDGKPPQREGVLSDLRSRSESEWIRDRNYPGKGKIKYVCRACGYWQTVRAQNASRLLSRLRYCPGCGKKMKTKEKDIV